MVTKANLELLRARSWRCVCATRVRVGESEVRFEQLTLPSKVQARALELVREAPVVA